MRSFSYFLKISILGFSIMLLFSCSKEEGTDELTESELVFNEEIVVLEQNSNDFFQGFNQGVLTYSSGYSQVDSLKEGMIITVEYPIGNENFVFLKRVDKVLKSQQVIEFETSDVNFFDILSSGYIVEKVDIIDNRYNWDKLLYDEDGDPSTPNDNIWFREDIYLKACANFGVGKINGENIINVELSVESIDNITTLEINNLNNIGEEKELWSRRLFPIRIGIIWFTPNLVFSGGIDFENSNKIEVGFDVKGNYNFDIQTDFENLNVESQDNVEFGPIGEFEIDLRLEAFLKAGLQFHLFDYDDKYVESTFKLYLRAESDNALEGNCQVFTGLDLNAGLFWYPPSISLESNSLNIYEELIYECDSGCMFNFVEDQLVLDINPLPSGGGTDMTYNPSPLYPLSVNKMTYGFFRDPFLIGIQQPPFFGYMVNDKITNLFEFDKPFDLINQVEPMIKYQGNDVYFYNENNAYIVKNNTIELINEFESTVVGLFLNTEDQICIFTEDEGFYYRDESSEPISFETTPDLGSETPALQYPANKAILGSSSFISLSGDGFYFWEVDDTEKTITLTSFSPLRDILQTDNDIILYWNYSFNNRHFILYAENLMNGQSEVRLVELEYSEQNSSLTVINSVNIFEGQFDGFFQQPSFRFSEHGALVYYTFGSSTTDAILTYTSFENNSMKKYDLYAGEDCVDIDVFALTMKYAHVLEKDTFQTYYSLPGADYLLKYKYYKK